MKKSILLIFIFSLALLLRLINIDHNPPALYGDELTITLDAYSILKTGDDQLGNFLPLTFQMGAGRPAGYVYGSVPFVAMFGPSALGVRMLSVLSGFGVVVLMFLLVKKIISERVAIAAAGITAFSPWEISLSRGGFEAHLALFLVLLGIYLALLASQRPLLYILAALSFGLTFHTYPTYKVSLLLFLPLLFWYQNSLADVFKNKGKQHFIIAVTVFVFLGVSALSQTFVGGSEARFSAINIFSQTELKTIIEQKINSERQITELPAAVSKYFYNKPVEYIKIFLENYLKNFSVDFLVLQGDGNPRHNPATMGELYFAEIILILIGILAFWERQRKIIYFCLVWILLAPVPAALIDMPHALRSSFMLPPLVILSSLGLVALFNRRHKILFTITATIFTVQFIFFAQKIFFLSPNEHSNFWSYPAKLATETAKEKKVKYNYVILSDRIDNIEYAYPVYTEVDPAIIISQNKTRTLLNNTQMKKFDNVYIGHISNNKIEEFMNSLEGSVLYIGPADEEKFVSKPILIDNLDGLKALILKEKGFRL